MLLKYSNLSLSGEVMLNKRNLKEVYICGGINVTSGPINFDISLVVA